MDVTCERCSTEYEFDETLVSERGTTVKCTNCGHLFKVYRNEGEGERPWILRRADGSEQTLASLRELQQAITQGQVDENDRISRSGEAWKRLGDIAELRTFFQAAKAASTAGAPEEGRKQTLFGVGTAPAPSPPRPAPKVSAPPPRPTPPPKVSAPPPRPKVSAPPPKVSKPPAPKPRPPTPAAPPTPAPPPANIAPRIDESAATEAAPQRAPKISDAPPAPAPQGRAPRLNEPTERVPRPARPAATGALYIDDEEESALPARGGGGRPFLWVALILLAAAGVTGALLWDQIGPMIGLGPENPAAPFLAEGDEAFALGTIDGYDDAVRAYTRASAIAPTDPAVFSALARAEVYWAQMLAFQAADIDARLEAAASALAAEGDEDEEADHDNDDDEEAPEAAPPIDPALRGEAARIRAEQRRHAERGQESAETALSINDGFGAAEVALAGASRLLGENDEAQTHIDRAQERLPERTADFHLARALLAAATGTMSDAADGAAAAVEADATLVLAKLTLARAHLAGGNVAGAREQTRAILAAHPEHTAAAELESAMDRGVPPASPLIGMPAEGSEGETPEPEPETPEPETPEAETPEPETPEPRANNTGMSSSGMGRSAPADGPPPGGRDYSWYIDQGDTLMDRGNIGRAREYYQAAVEVRPGASEALTGLGYVELERRRYDAAVRYFQQARRNHYGDAYIGLGEALRRMGRREEAANVYEDYLASRPNGPQANVARRQLEALRPAETPQAPEEPEPGPAPTMDPAPEEAPAPTPEEPSGETP